MAPHEQLKLVRDACQAHKWDKALELAQDILSRDPEDYTIQILVADLLLQNRGQFDVAEQMYETAAHQQPAKPAAWQALTRLYEKQKLPSKLTKYKTAVLKLATILHAQNDMRKCQDVVHKFVQFANVHGTRTQYVDALEVTLPDNPFYPALECRRQPHPATTYETMAELLEADQKKRINHLIGERRTRIGAKLSEVTVEVKREVLGSSKLCSVYENLINWTRDDDLRRTCEEKLLQLRYDRLMVFPSGPRKKKELAVVEKLAKDMVIINHPMRLAWDITVDWQDGKDIKDWDVNLLEAYCSHFPNSDLYKVLIGFMTSKISPFPKKASAASAVADTDDSDDDSSQDEEEGGAPTAMVPVTDEERLLMMVEGVGTANSLLAYRLMGEYYQHLEEHESTVELMRKAMPAVTDMSQKTGKAFTNTHQAFMLHLGTALVYYQSPRNHGEAKSLFDKVLEMDPSSSSALIGIGLIYAEEEEYTAAIDFLERALQRDHDNVRVRAEVAWLYALKGDYSRGRADLEPLLETMSRKGASSKEVLSQTQYRLGVCIWNQDTSPAARKRRDGAYALFLEALKSDFSYAPAYTSLGLYYADYAKDNKRARKCFLKAVELSSSELVSAERLARSFADDGDWDRVELVAQRVVDSGKVRPPPGSKRKGISWPFAALGVAELNKQEYNKAIVAFQSSLRMAPDDYHSWVGLGESYFSSGRYVAAIKALVNAQRLEGAADTTSFAWFTQYMLGNVKREIGDYDEAIALFREVTTTRPDEEGVAIALVQTMVENALDSADKGLFGKAVDLAVETTTFALTVPPPVLESFNFWKAIGDACSVFSLVRSRAGDLPTESLRQLLAKGADNFYGTMSEVDLVDPTFTGAAGHPDDESLGPDLSRSLHATILAHKRAVHLSARDIHAQAIAYYNLGWAEHRAHVCLPASVRSKPTRYHQAAIKCFKRAIELEAGNSTFWNSLGVVTSEISPAVAQHSFVRSLYLSERNAHTWTNLGALALLQNDVQLANEAFTKAQSNDPDYGHAWLGQAFVALLYGDVKEARVLFTHAMGMSDSSCTLPRRQYSVSLFDHIVTQPPTPDLATLIQPLFVLNQLQELDPHELAYVHLSTFFLERTNDSARAIARLEKACDKLDAHYEATESPAVLAHFASAKTDLARFYLAAGRYDDAVECGEMALQLSVDEADHELTAKQRNTARLSANLTVGLGHYFQKDVADALEYFDAALQESDGNPDAVCILSQVLWADGTAEARERARSLLFEVIEKDPGHVQSVLLLTVIALLDGDEESLEAVTAEMQTLRTSNKVTEAENSRINQVLRAVAALAPGSTEDNVLTEVQTEVMLHPHLPHPWSRLAELGGEAYPAETALKVALKVALKAAPPRGVVSSTDLAAAYAGTTKVADAQTAIVIAPWSKEGWSSLARGVGVGVGVGA